MTRPNNLYDSLYLDDDDSDIGMLAINEMYGHLNFEDMSNYISLLKYNNIFPSHNKNILSIFHFNIRSLETNLVQLEALIANFNQVPDIIAISETWLDENNADDFTLEGYNSYHVDPMKHGGVSLFIRDHLVCEKIDESQFLH